MEGIRNPLAEDEQKRKRLMALMVAGLVLAVVLVGYFLFSAQKSSRRRTVPPPQLKTSRPDIVKETWLAKGTVQLTEQQKELENLKKQIKDLQEQMKKRQKEVEKREKKSPLFTFGSHKKASYPPPPPMPKGHLVGSTGRGSLLPVAGPAARGRKRGPVDLIAVVKGDTTSGSQVPPASTSPQISRKKKRSTNDMIPAGSFVKGILLSGLDAPTGGKAKSMPSPVLIRLVDRAVLPNRWRSDIKDCFVVGEGYGDLSSERVFIRLNTLSCVARDGNVLERKVKGYVAGEDGKVGLVGRVVSKQGQLLARTIIAGFLEGIANAFRQSMTTFTFSPLGSTQAVPPGRAFSTSAVSGASTSAKKLADFYMKLINETFPVIEVNAGRRVDLVFLEKVDFGGEK